MNRLTSIRLAPALAAVMLVLTSGALAGLVGAAPALAEATPAPADLVGKPVRDVDGKTLGVIEKVIANAAGQIRQVQVRTRKGPVSVLRTLPFASLRPDAGAYVSVLTQAEYEAMPTAP